MSAPVINATTSGWSELATVILEYYLHINLIVGTYDLFRLYYARPPARDRQEIGDGGAQARL